MSVDDSTMPQPHDGGRSAEDRKRRRRAILAGGIVLGLGAAATLATWSDDLWAKGSFQTGSFDLVGSKVPNSSSFGDYQQYATEQQAADLTSVTPAEGGGVNFAINSLNLSPGETVVAPFSVATTQDTSTDGRYWLQEAKVDAGKLAPFLTFSIVQSATCTADDPATAANEQTSMANPWKTNTFSAPIETETFGSIRSAAAPGADIPLQQKFGNQSHLCIGVTLADDQDAIKAAGAQGDAGKTTITWHFKGEASPLTE